MSKHPKPHGDSPHTNQHDDGGKNNERSISGKINVSGSVETQLPPDFIEKYEAAEAAREAREDKRFILEIVTFAAGLIIIFFAGVQMKTGRDNLVVLQRQFALDQRPVIVVGGPKLAYPTIGEGIKLPIVGKPLEINLVFKNIGKSNALNVAPSRFVFTGPNADKEMMVPREPYYGGQVVPSQVERLTTAKLVKDERNYGTSALGQDPLPWDGSLPIIVFGNVYYRDAFGGTYCTVFGWRYLGTTTEAGGWMDVAESNTANCEDKQPK
jgi:hypothetical protein